MIPDFPLLFRLLRSTFRLQKNSLHAPSWRRVSFFLFGAPVLFLFIITNQLFLLLDLLLFPSFRKTQVSHPVFIVGIPRSATTFAHHLLTRDDRFTSFKLWEVIFAPSIIQKYLILALMRLDRRFGGRFGRLIRRIESRLIGRFQHVHPLSLASPEEDEPLLINGLCSLYLFYLFPEAPEVRSLLFFDQTLAERKKRRIMRFYWRCIQRHLYVFDPQGQRVFLSKNPAFCAKIESLVAGFPTCRIIYLLRSPLQTIPSTISLNDHIFQLFSRVLPDEERDLQTREIILQWYRMSLATLVKLPARQSIIIPFKLLTRQPREALLRCYSILPMSMQSLPTEAQENWIRTHQGYRSQHSYSAERGLLPTDQAALLKSLGLEDFQHLI